jgi:hypothetical protein
MIVTFKCARDMESKKLGQEKTFKMQVLFEGVSDEIIRKHAIANMVVSWQSQVRANWGKELPATVTFGQALFESKRSSGLTVEQQALNMNRKAQLELIMKLMGDNCPPEIEQEYDALVDAE